MLVCLPVHWPRAFVLPCTCTTNTGPPDSLQQDPTTINDKCSKGVCIGIPLNPTCTNMGVCSYPQYATTTPNQPCVIGKNCTIAAYVGP